MRTFIRFAIGAAAVVGSVGVAQAERVSNGGFEAPSITGSYSVFTQASQGINSWTVTTGSVDLVKAPTYTVAAGSQAVDLLGTGTATGGIGQSFATVADQMYKIVFSYAGNSDTRDLLSAGFSVTDGANNFVTSTTPGLASGTVEALGGSAYRTYTGYFTAASMNTSLSFFDLSGHGNQGIFLDSVSVEAVPEAATWGMMIIGFGAVGGVMRRRRSTRFSPATA